MKTRFLIIIAFVIALGFVETALATHDPTYNHPNYSKNVYPPTNEIFVIDGYDIISNNSAVSEIILDWDSPNLPEGEITFENPFTGTLEIQIPKSMPRAMNLSSITSLFLNIDETIDGLHVFESNNVLYDDRITETSTECHYILTMNLENVTNFEFGTGSLPVGKWEPVSIMNQACGDYLLKQQIKNNYMEDLVDQYASYANTSFELEEKLKSLEKELLEASTDSQRVSVIQSEIDELKVQLDSISKSALLVQKTIDKELTMDSKLEEKLETARLILLDSQDIIPWSGLGTSNTHQAVEISIVSDDPESFRPAIEKLIGADVPLIIKQGAKDPFTTRGQIENGVKPFAMSLKQQIKNNMSADEIECRNDKHVLAERENGELACVSPSNAQILGWYVHSTNEWSYDGPEIHIETSTFEVVKDDKIFDVEYEILGGMIQDMVYQKDVTSMMITMNATNEGSLTVTIPRDLIDSRRDYCPPREENPPDDMFFVLVNEGIYDFGMGFKEIFYTEILTTPENRTLQIPFLQNATNIQIIGMCYI